MVIWFIGLSGSGKTTLGYEVSRQLKLKYSNTVFLDGDELRKLFGFENKNSYSIAGRRKNAELIVNLCELLDKQGIHVVCCILSIFPDMRLNNRKRFSKYIEIFMDAPLDVLIARDVKGLYKKALNGHMKDVVGIDIPFERPKGSDIVVDSSKEEVNISELAQEVLKYANL